MFVNFMPGYYEGTTLFKGKFELIELPKKFKKELKAIVRSQRLDTFSLKETRSGIIVISKFELHFNDNTPLDKVYIELRFLERRLKNYILEKLELLPPISESF